MSDATVTYIIRANNEGFVNSRYYMNNLYYLGWTFYEGQYPTPYEWATHPCDAQQYASEVEAQEVIGGLPTHANPQVITYQHAIDEHWGCPAPYPFNVKFMPSDEQHAAELAEEYDPEQNEMPEADEPIEEQDSLFDSSA